MLGFDEIRQRIESADKLSKLSSAEADALRREHPSVPEEYVEFLVSVGYGDLGPLNLYSGPVSPWEIYPQRPPSLAGVVLFGDDSQGCCFGFDVNDSYRVVEVDPRGSVDRTIEAHFSELLRGYFEAGG